MTSFLSNQSVQFIEVLGQATTFNYGRVLVPALSSARKGRFSVMPGLLRDPAGQCTPCSTWAMFRPRPVLLRALAHTPVAASTPLVCLKVSSRRIPCDAKQLQTMSAPRRSSPRCAPYPVALTHRGRPSPQRQGRTMYAEDKRYLPDSTPPTLDAIDRLWLSYSDKLQMGDETYWGPRPRLRCDKRLIPPGEALRCMMKVLAS